MSSRLDFRADDVDVIKFEVVDTDGADERETEDDTGEGNDLLSEIMREDTFFDEDSGDMLRSVLVALVFTVDKSDNWRRLIKRFASCLMRSMSSC